MKVPGSSKPADQLRLVVVKVGFTQAELASLDARRGHYPRAVFLRAAGLDAKLQAAPGEELAVTWEKTARVQSCFRQINGHASDLNSLALAEGPEAAARELLARSGDMLNDFMEFRLRVFAGQEA